MPKIAILKALLLVSCLALAAAPPPAKTPVAPLLPGEALALSGPDGQVYLFGDASTELPMGSLAKLVWLKLEGSEWGAMNLSFNCTGALKADRCWLPKGHGRLDLGKALAEDCDLAFLAWGQASVQWWLRDYGEGAARARLEDAFGPFLGKRMPGGEDLPVIDAPWVGMGDLLRTSPEGMLRWLVDPAQDELLRIAKRHLLSFKQYNFRQNAWWVQVGSAPVPSVPGATSIWAVGSNGQITAVLHLPQGRTRADGMARFRAVLMVQPDK
jgi:hypothetical protein